MNFITKNIKEANDYQNSRFKTARDNHSFDASNSRNQNLIFDSIKNANKTSYVNTNQNSSGSSTEYLSSQYTNRIMQKTIKTRAREANLKFHSHFVPSKNLSSEDENLLASKPKPQQMQTARQNITKKPNINTND